MSMTFRDILEYDFIRFNEYHVNLLDILEVMAILVVVRGLVWGIKRVLERSLFKGNRVDPGRKYAILQFIKYILYTGGILVALQSIGVKLSILLAGSAALLVGVGLGLQQTFNDLISGLILLVEGGVSVGDILQVEGQVGKVTKIGLRTSNINTRDDIDLIIPNSKLITENVTNWSHNATPARFQIAFGVSYDSEVRRVQEIVLKVAGEHQAVLSFPTAWVEFKDFGDSSLDFVLHFYSNEFWRIERVRSDLRYAILAKFREAGVEIPFPQRDVWMRSEGSESGKG